MAKRRFSPVPAVAAGAIIATVAIVGFASHDRAHAAATAGGASTPPRVASASAQPGGPPDQPVPTAVAHAGPVAVSLTEGPSFQTTSAQATSSSAPLMTYPSPGKTNHTAAIVGSQLTLDGKAIASDFGRIVWSNDGTVLFYDTAPPLTDPTAEEPVYAVTPGSPPKQVATTGDPWRLSAAGSQSAAFEQNGILKIVNGRTGAVSNTSIQLPNAASAGEPGYPNLDSDFLVSPDLKYAVVANPQNQLTLYNLATGPSGFTVKAKQSLPGLISGNRDQWGAWQSNGSQFLYAIQTPRMFPRLDLWTAKTNTVTKLGSQLAPAEIGQYMILGWTSRYNSNEFVVDKAHFGSSVTGPYLLGRTDGTIVETLWNNGVGGYMTPDDSTITFSNGVSARRWTAHLTW